MMEERSELWGVLEENLIGSLYSHCQCYVCKTMSILSWTWGKKDWIPAQSWICLQHRGSPLPHAVSSSVSQHFPLSVYRPCHNPSAHSSHLRWASPDPSQQLCISTTPFQVFGWSILIFSTQTLLLFFILPSATHKKVELVFFCFPGRMPPLSFPIWCKCPIWHIFLIEWSLLVL